MCRVLSPAVYVAVAQILLAAPAQDDQPRKSALESSAKGWEKLPADTDAWKRIAAQPKVKLGPKSPWSFDKDGVLHYAGGVQELLLLNPGPKTNGIFHDEWRYKQPPANGTATGGLLVRTSLKGDIWH